MIRASSRGSASRSTSKTRSAASSRTMLRRLSRKGLECYDCIEAVVENLSGMHAVRIGNTVKYLFRCAKKSSYRQDIQKAIEYLQRELEDYDRNERRSTR